MHSVRSSSPPSASMEEAVVVRGRFHLLAAPQARHPLATRFLTPLCALLSALRPQVRSALVQDVRLVKKIRLLEVSPQYKYFVEGYSSRNTASLSRLTNNGPGRGLGAAERQHNTSVSRRVPTNRTNLRDSRTPIGTQPSGAC